MKKLVLLRHGESVWNKANRFTGWTDVGLTEKGVAEAIEAGRSLAREGFDFDVAYTSVLKRAIKTLWLALEEMDRMWLPVHRHWRLNDRHYGALQGLNKAETAEQHGEAQVKIWRRSYDTRPPALTPDDERHPGRDRRYADLTPDQLPLTECLKDTVARMLPHWFDTIAPEVQAGRRVLVAVDGIYSMDGDTAPLAEMAALTQRWGALLLLDDAHGTGTLGATGRGTAELCGVENAVDVWMGTLGKSLGSFGAFVAGGQRLRELLVNVARSFIFSCALAPPQVEAARAALRLLRAEPWRRDRLQRNASHLRRRLSERGVDTHPSTTHIIPVHIGEISSVHIRHLFPMPICLANINQRQFKTLL